MDAQSSFESGIPFEFILAYLEKELALEETGAGDFLYKNARISVTPLPPRELGRLQLPRTQVCIQGDSMDIEAFERSFLLRFLSAGG